jgi:hypothetical protein
MAKTEHQYLENIQRMFDDPDFHTLCDRVKFEFFEAWQRERKPDERERIHAKLQALDALLNAMRSAADSIAFEKQRST